MSKENLSVVGGSLSAVGRELFDLIEKVEGNPENRRIDPKDFIDYSVPMAGRVVNLFPKAEVEADLQRVEERRRAFTEKSQVVEKIDNGEVSAMAALVESMLPQLIRELAWLGERVKVINSSLYDDYFNKIDGALQLLPDREIRDERDIRCVGFSIDFTLSQKEALGKIFDQIVFLSQGRIPKMKYFQTEISTLQGPKDIKLRDFKIPHVILACSGDLVEDSVDDFTAYEEGAEDSNLRERLDNCDLKFYFIRETVSQLIFFAELLEKFIELEKAEGNDQNLIGNYRRALEMYDNASAELIGIVKSMGYDSQVIRERIKHIPSPTDKFDLNKPEGKQLLSIVRAMPRK